jgi:hypothetical protein
MKNPVLPIFILLVLTSFTLSAADDDRNAGYLDMQALAKRFDAEAKPYFTVDKNTTFVKVDGGFAYLPEGSLVPSSQWQVIYFSI